MKAFLRPGDYPHRNAPELLGLGYKTSSVARQGLLSGRNRVHVQLV
ncbi:MAG TPA: hypothetical protein VG675_08790 [Bryobacteraceae bacterium]|nr:hypothetical protein [Bryobacteraceae bacterium]